MNMSEWISVKESLPKLDLFVDVYLKSTQNSTYGERQTDVRFSAGTFYYKNSFNCVYVSHWMPKPKPPTQE